MMTMQKTPLAKLMASNRGRGRFEIAAAADKDEATVYLYDMIVDTDDDAYWWGGVSATSFVKEYAAIDKSTIHLRVNSPGGSVFAGRAMEQAIRQHSARTIVHVDGLAASAASFLIMPAAEIRMAPGAFLMIHKAWSIALGNEDDFRKEADLLGQIDASLAKSYNKRTGIAEDELAAMLAEETWMEASRAVELKFADAVEDDEGPGNRIAWDLTAYQAAPAAARLAARPARPQPGARACTPAQPDREAMRRDVLRALIPA